MSTHARNILICAGLDPSGGAGFVADCRVVTACGGRPVGVITAHTVQNTLGVRAVHVVDPLLLQQQLTALLDDVSVAAIKIGMLGSLDVARVVVAAAQRAAVPVIWDPIIMPTRGAVPLFSGELADVLALFATLPRVIITPNSVELAALLGRSTTITDSAALRNAAIELATRTGMHVLAKAGHLSIASAEGDAASAASLVDILIEHRGTATTAAAPSAEPYNVHSLPTPRLGLPVGGVHGTGCALASALATYLGHGEPLVNACQRAQRWVHQHIAASVLPGAGAAAVV